MESTYFETDEEYIKAAWPTLHIVKFLSVGSYQGTNYVIGTDGGKVLASGYGYGSCSGCGAWGEGGEPTSPRDLIDSGVYGKTLEETLEWLKAEAKNNEWDLKPSDVVHLREAIKQAFNIA